MNRAMSWGSCGLNGSKSSLSGGGWGCVSTWLVGLRCSSTGADRLVGANKLEGGFQSDSCQHQCPCGRMSSLK